MDLCNELCLSGWPAIWLAILHNKNFNIGHLYPNFLTYFFHTCRFYRHNIIDICYFMQFALTVHGGHKVKPLGFIFSHTFQLIRMKFSIVLKHFKLNIQYYFGVKAGEITAVLLTA